MSVDLRLEAAGKVVIIEIQGRLTRENYAHFLPEVERVISEHGKVRMLVRFQQFHGWTMGALWEDFKFGWQHSRHLERLAFVGERKRMAFLAGICRPFTAAKIRTFAESEFDEALNWIEEGIALPV